jgi:hypothetical protein
MFGMLEVRRDYNIKVILNFLEGLKNGDSRKLQRSAKIAENFQ